MPENKITIKFQGTGHDKLRNQINSIAEAQERLNGQTRKGAKEGNGLLKGNRLINTNLATMRSHLLLVNFAMALFINRIVSASKEAAKLQSMERAFNSLSGGVSSASVAMTELREATNNTASDFDLFQQANNAMILGVTSSSQEMAHMFDMAQRLGSALGRDTKSSVESLITGIGRQSRLMLDNIGIIVKADRAYEDYALQLGLLAVDLSDAQKKQAFFNATMEAAEQKVQGLPEEIDNADVSFQRFGATVSNATSKLGDFFMPVVTSVMDGLSNLNEHFTDIDFDTAMASESVDLITKALNKTRVEVGLLERSPFIKGKLFGKSRREELAQYRDEVEKLRDRLIQVQDPLVIISKPISFPFSPEDPDFDEAAFNNKLKRESELKVLMLEQVALEDNFISVLEQKGIMQEQLTQAQELRDAGIITENELLKLQIVLKKKGMSLDAKDAQAKIKNYSKIAGGLAGLNDAMKGSMKVTVRLQQIQAMIDAYAGAQSGWAQNKKAYPSPIPALLYAADIAVGLAQARALSTSIGDKMEQGGLIGGRRHSQGGTMINAEQGEFIMSRNAVNAVGVEAMNRINQGGGAGAVSINFTGNVMSQDFIEDEAIPMIKEAIRRGADIGVA